MRDELPNETHPNAAFVPTKQKAARSRRPDGSEGTAFPLNEFLDGFVSIEEIVRTA
jgi:hypothetical protein